MKPTLLLLTLLISTLSYAQLVTYEEFEAAENQKKVELDSYQAKNGQVFKIGDKITIAQPSMRNDQYLSVLMNDLGTRKRISISIKGFEAEIKKFRVVGRKRIGYSVVAVTKGVDGLANYWIAIEEAIESGEIETSGLNREQAIAKLKESKDLLDLEMISKEEYEKIKEELSPIINNN
ncbi:MAG: hypothetical protein WDZ45_11285 [Flavobacteriaceae bacterium]